MSKRGIFYNLILSPLLMIFIVCLFFILPISNIFSPTKIDDIWNISLDDLENHFVEVKVQDLHYTGYNTKDTFNRDYGYYYLQKHGKCIFVIIPLADDSSETIENYTIKGKVVSTQDYTSYDELLSSVSSDLGWNSTDLSNITLNYMVSETSYTPYFYCIIIAFLAVCFLILLFFFIRQLICKF